MLSRRWTTGSERKIRSRERRRITAVSRWLKRLRYGSRDERVADGHDRLRAGRGRLGGRVNSRGPRRSQPGPDARGGPSERDRRTARDLGVALRGTPEGQRRDRQRAARTRHRRVKRRDLERHLRAHGARLLREGGNHSFWGSTPIARPLSRATERSTSGSHARSASTSPSRPRRRRAERSPE